MGRINCHKVAAMQGFTIWLRVEEPHLLLKAVIPGFSTELVEIQHDRNILSSRDFPFEAGGITLSLPPKWFATEDGEGVHLIPPYLYGRAIRSGQGLVVRKTREGQPGKFREKRSNNDGTDSVSQDGYAFYRLSD